MNIRIRVIVALAILLGSFGIMSRRIPKAAALTIRVPMDYPTIQDAVDAANPGDTILVANGTYHERINLHKNGLSLLGENPKATIIDSDFIDQPIYITSNSIYIGGFTMRDGARCGIYLDHVSNISLVGNIVDNNTNYGIYLDNSINDTITQNTISNNLPGISLWYSNGSIIYHNTFNNKIQATAGASTNTWDKGYPSGGNYWSNYTVADEKYGPNQDHPGNDGIGDTTYTIDTNNMDNYPLMEPWTPPIGHNVAVISVVGLKTVVGQGFSSNVTVYVANKGEYTERFNVTTYTDKTVIGTLANVTLTGGDSTSITFTWNTAGLAYGNYTISAYVWRVPGETNTTDNTFSDGTMIVSHVGDVTGDAKVDIQDLARVSAAFGSLRINDPHHRRYGQYWHTTPCPGCPHTPNADVNNDGRIDIQDLARTSAYFGWHRP
jgi:parallel beta-helix repeat protein